jgi:hypothetical protein
MLVANRFATPSILDEVSAEQEAELRVFGCQVLFQSGVLLRLSAVTISTAQTLLHRFYFVKFGVFVGFFLLLNVFLGFLLLGLLFDCLLSFGNSLFASTM